jgi:hypothetical protein
MDSTVPAMHDLRTLFVALAAMVYLGQMVIPQPLSPREVGEGFPRSRLRFSRKTFEESTSALIACS